MSVTFCPLRNTAVVFDRSVDERGLDFGTTGKLRYSDLVVYDRQTESWWQQFLGEAIIGELVGAVLKVVPARIESFARFCARAPEGRVLLPNSPASLLFRRGASRDRAARSCGDSRAQAWSLDLVRERVAMRVLDDVIISWEAGQNSALGAGVIAEARDVGNVVAQRETADGLIDVPY